MATLAPRVVVVSRRSELDELLSRHGTSAAAGYFLKQRGRKVSDVQRQHTSLQEALDAINAALPADWRRGHVDRDDLPRFLFAPEDIVITVGQDGLVANVAKYLDGQPVIGINTDPRRNPGVLACFAPDEVGKVLPRVLSGKAAQQKRAMATATLDDGQRISGLNEIYIGHSSHQSSRYLLTTPDGRQERHSSSGIVVGTGTGSTGWCVSIAGERAMQAELPAPVAMELAWFVREAWPSPGTGATLTTGRISARDALTITCESERLVAFADGVETDHLVLSYGQQITVGVSNKQLNLVVS